MAASRWANIRHWTWRKLSRWARLRDPAKDLSSILSTARSSAPLQEKILWLANLISWIRGPVLSLDTASSGRAVTVRMRFLLQLLERHDHWREEVARSVLSILTEADATSLFAQTELTEQGGLFTEISRRLVAKITPPVPRPHELHYAVDVIFADIDDAEWLEALPLEVWRQILAALGRESDGGNGARLNLSGALQDAVVNLSIQAAALGLTPEIRHRSEDSPGETSPFIELNKNVMTVGIADIEDKLTKCRSTLARIYKKIETSGVSLGLLYRLETLTGLLNRISLIQQIDERTGPEREALIRDFLAEIVRVAISRRSVKKVLRMNFDIFARKLVEHAGETGEHYITRTRSEYWAMFRSGAGGGILMVPTTFVKFAISSLKLPQFFEGFTHGLNYSISFSTMQFLGFTLATKQPAMTAAALAERLSSTMTRERIGEFALEVIRITRSQFIAAVGNVGLVVPGVLLASWFSKAVFAKPVMNAAYAEKTLLSLHAWKSGSILYAAMAGVLLWLSSLCAGWVQNWVTYREVPEAVARHRTLNIFLGEHRCRALGNWIGNHATGLGGNISIGFLLAFTPVFGQFFGLPIDIRHITLSSATLAVALSSMDPAALTWQLVAPAILGIALIGVLNFGVSTALALLVAVRAKKVRWIWVRALLQHVGRLFVSRSSEFFFPPRDENSPPPTH